MRPKLKNPDTENLLDALDQLDAMGRIHWPKKEGGVPSFIQFEDEMEGVELQSIWSDVSPIGAAGANVSRVWSTPFVVAVNVRNAMVAGTVGSVTVLELNGHPARDVSISTGQSELHMRFVVVGDTVLHAAVGGPGLSANDKWVKRVRESLTLAP